MTERYICIHGHFYQPPRENPWLEAIELQDSAYPYHDWNERITAECYAPNAVSRILDAEGWILKMVNNYAKMSFDCGPTLLAWLQDKAPEVYRAVLHADRESQGAFSGHGSAMAQAYNHMIMPLANRRDKETQVSWGIRDFEHRFGRSPEGMWLPETAVDLETLDIMARHGVRFTILAQHQAKQVRSLTKRGPWQDASQGPIDPTMAYRVDLPSGRNVAVFFYDGPISRAVAFEGLLTRGESFAHRLLKGFNEERTWPQLMHIATDGESYGHHHPFGDMALAYALHYIESQGLARVTNYGEYLERHPPLRAVELRENSSWSCAHGVERWRSDCGCNSGGHPGWGQGWRAPLREALDWLRDTLASAYERWARSRLRDPWKARDDYIQVVLDRSPENVKSFFGRHGIEGLSDRDEVTGLKFLELQRHAMLMYTSCGWFFDEISGLESLQDLQYAGRAIQLAEAILGDGIESEFLTRLEHAKGNIPEHGDGRVVYEKFVKPARIDLLKVAAHYAVSSLFESYGETHRLFCYSVDRHDDRTSEVGKARLAMGKIRVTSEITRDSALINFGVLHFGDHNFSGGAREFQDEEAYDAMARELTEAFVKADFPEAIRRIDHHFGASTYSLRSLFRDQQRKITARILQATVDEAAAAYGQLYEHHAPLMRFLKDLGIPAPKGLYVAAELYINEALRRAFEEEEPGPETIHHLLEEAEGGAIALDAPTLEHSLRWSMETMARRLREEPSDLSRLKKFHMVLDISSRMPFRVTRWQAENVCYEIARLCRPEFEAMAKAGDEHATEWVALFTALISKLRIHVG